MQESHRRREQADFPALRRLGRQVPQANCSIFTVVGDEQPSVRAPGHLDSLAPGAVEHLLLAQRPKVPQADGLVGMAGRSQGAAVRQKRDGADGTLVALQGCQQPTGKRVPQPYCAVGTGSGEQPAVRAGDGNAVGGERSRQQAQTLAGGRVPNVNRVAVLVGGQPAAVGRCRQMPGGPGQRPQLFAGGRVPEFDRLADRTGGGEHE